MKIRLLLILCLFLASCRTIKTNYGRDAQYYNTTVIDRQEKANDKINDQVVLSENTAEEVVSEEIEEPISASSTNRMDGIDHSVSSKHNIETANKPKTDDEPDEISNEEKLDQAVWAEKQATISSVFAALGLAGSIFMPPLGLLMVILGFVFFYRGNRSRFITANGERTLNLSKVLLILSTAILLLWLGLIIVFVFL